jgi:hypothetical protein
LLQHFSFEEVVMTTKQDKKNTLLFPGMKLGTQEEATAINNGGATQIVLDRRSSKSDRINPNEYSDVTTNDTKEE